MSSKLLWTGATMMLAFPQFDVLSDFSPFGAIVMVIGLVLLWLDK